MNEQNSKDSFNSINSGSDIYRQHTRGERWDGCNRRLFYYLYLMRKLIRFFSIKRNKIIIGIIWVTLIIALSISTIVTEQLDYQIKYGTYADLTKSILFFLVVIPGGIFGIFLVGLIISVIIKKIIKLIKWITS